MSDPAACALISAPRRSIARLRALCARAFDDTFSATPKSQLASDSARRIEPARLARIRNVAWAASSASCRSPSAAWQTERTIGPCRSTRAANAAAESSSPRPARNRSSSAPSASAPSTPASKTVRKYRDAPTRCSLMIVISSPSLQASDWIHPDPMVPAEARGPPRFFGRT